MVTYYKSTETNKIHSVNGAFTQEDVGTEIFCVVEQVTVAEGKELNLVAVDATKDAAFLKTYPDNKYKPTLVNKTTSNLLSEEKTKVIAAITEYDTSTAVNSFTYKGQEMWVPRADRLAIVSGINAEKSLGETETTITLPTGAQVTLPIDTALSLLYSIEAYAKKCFNKTSKHKVAVMQLTTLKKVKAYDYQTGYPTKLTID